MVPISACAQDAPRDAETALRTGRYAEAISMARDALSRNPGDVQVRRTLVQALAETGKYADAEAAAREGNSQQLANLLGEVLYAEGKIGEAEAAFRRGAESGSPHRLMAEANLAELLLERGQRDEAFTRFDRFIDIYNGGAALGAQDLTAVGTAVQHLGVRDHKLFQDALKAYDQAIAADPAYLEPKLRVGELFLDKYDSGEAQKSFQEVLAINPSHPRALLGMARAKEFDGATGEAFELVRRALQVNPNFVPALVTLARLDLGYEDTRTAEQQVQKALAVNPASLDALAVLGAIRFVTGDEAAYRQARDRVLRLAPFHAEFYTTVAEIAANYRRYAQAATLAQEGVKLDPQSWTGYGVLGLNQLRLGQVEAAQASLNRSFEGDPYNAWIKNTLDLLDTYPEYQVRKTPRFELVLHGDEADLLYPYFAQIAEESYDSLANRFGYRPATPVRLEVYPRHADFSVRTVGLAGLGALGVSFGNVLAMDSPRAREPGQLNWGSTLWHELAHAVTLGVSNNRVPRWLTEGISVREERRARPGWGSEMVPSFLAAYYEDELPPVSRLNEGFIRPKSPGHLGLAYHMASMVVEWIEETRGFDSVIRMLKAYGEGQSTEQVLRTGLRMEPAAIDKAFDAWVRERYPPALAGQLRGQMEGARASLQRGDTAQAKRQLARAAEMMPSWGEPGESALAILAALHLRSGDNRAAAAALTRLTAVDENAYAENL
ncbi:MAG: tetratricopeptide repeat protein, partial [Gemmatimonadetes bacterium]|nr:tetratricopeptide repeat protein [Gemmatimonadota bacterium]